MLWSDWLASIGASFDQLKCQFVSKSLSIGRNIHCFQYCSQSCPQLSCGQSYTSVLASYSACIIVRGLCPRILVQSMMIEIDTETRLHR